MALGDGAAMAKAPAGTADAAADAGAAGAGAAASSADAAAAAGDAAAAVAVPDGDACAADSTSAGGGTAGDGDAAAAMAAVADVERQVRALTTPVDAPRGVPAAVSGREGASGSAPTGGEMQKLFTVRFVASFESKVVQLTGRQVLFSSMQTNQGGPVPCISALLVKCDYDTMYTSLIPPSSLATNTVLHIFVSTQALTFPPTGRSPTS